MLQSCWIGKEIAAKKGAMHMVAIYDMDKTITRSPTWTPFLVHAAWRLAPWRLTLLPLAGVLALGYAVGLLDRARLKEVTQALLIGRAVPGDRLAAAAGAFADRIVAHGCFADATARIAADRAAGRRLVMATASYGFYAGAIGTRLGFDSVIATEAARDDAGRVLARIDGENCYGPAKLDRVQRWLAAENLDRSDLRLTFYSDHVSDAPTLAWVDEAVAVNPESPLRALAGERGWRIVSWR